MRVGLIFATALLSCYTTAIYGEGKNVKHAKVLILGAGASGIKAAETFYRKGMREFLVLEGKDYIGGRVYHAPLEGSLLPLGAGWIHDIGAENSAWSLAKELKMDVHYDNYAKFIVRDGNNGQKLRGMAKIYDKLKKKMKAVDKKTKKRTNEGRAVVPMKSTLGMVGWNPLSAVKETIEFYHLDFENGVSPKVLSSSIYSTTGSGTDVIVTDKRGYGYILEYLAAQFLKKVKLNTVVSEIIRSNSGVTVITSKGVRFTADHVLVTFSSGVLINNLVKFTPPLPSWKMDTIHLVPMCHYCKVYFKFPWRFWDDTNYILFARTNRGDHVHWQNFDKPTLFHNKHILLLTLTEDLCLRSEKMSNGDVIKEAMEALRKVYGTSIPLPVSILRNRWNSDPLTMGAYSNPVVGFVQEDYMRLQAPVGRVWFAGEYTTEDYGYVHGALDIGEKIAKKMLLQMGRKF